VKTNKELKVHLSSTAVAALYNAKRGEVSPNDPVCPSKDGGHLSTMCVTRALKRITKRVLDEGGRALRPHDLRRTFRTLLSRLGVAPHIADLCMNHQEEKTMRRAYDGHDYFSEMRQAWDWVGSHIDSLNYGGANVYPLAKRNRA
jgi:integrase